MLFKSLFESFVQLVFKPYIVIPAIVALLASTVFGILGDIFLEAPMIDLVLNPGVFSGANNLIALIIFNYPLTVIGTLVFGFILFMIWVIVFESIACISQGQKFVEAINDSVLQLRKSIGFTLILLAATVILFAVFWVNSEIMALINSELGIAIAIIITIICFVVLVKLAFTIPVLTEMELKKALMESWKFTNKRFWSSLALIIIAGIIMLAFTIIITQIGIVLGESFEVPLAIIGQAIGVTYFIAAITNFFYSKSK